jgi:oxalyl-CoA decarboxylase
MDKDYSEALWFKRVMEKGSYISDMFTGFRKVPHFVIAVARQEKGENWILRATIDTEAFRSLVENVRIGRTGEVYLVNEGANTLDLARSVIDMMEPRKRLDSGTWGVMGIGMGYAIGAAVTSGQPVVALEGDSAFGFSGMEVETICRYNLPVTVVIFNNNGVYKGCDVNPTGGVDPAPTVFVKGARYDMLMQAFGGEGCTVNTPEELSAALAQGISSGRPTLINVVIDEKAGTESGRIGNLNPQSKLQKKK